LHGRLLFHFHTQAYTPVYDDGMYAIVFGYYESCSLNTSVIDRFLRLEFILPIFLLVFMLRVL